MEQENLANSVVNEGIDKMILLFGKSTSMHDIDLHALADLFLKEQSRFNSLYFGLAAVYEMGRIDGNRQERTKRDNSQNLAGNQESILFKDWEDRYNRLNEVFEKNEDFNKESELCESIFQEMKEAFKNDERWNLIRDFETHTSYRETIIQDLSYKQGVKDGIRIIIDSLQNNIERS